MYRALRNKNLAEIARLRKLSENLKTLNRISGNKNAWRSLSVSNQHRLHLLDRARKRHPEQYTNLNKKMNVAHERRTYRALLYGYAPIVGGPNWVPKTDPVSQLSYMVPKNLPENEIRAFLRYTKQGALKPYTVVNKGGKPVSFKQNVIQFIRSARNVFTNEGSLRPIVYTARPKPVPAKTPARGFVPTLKRLTWNALPVKNMTNEQLNFLSTLTGTNWKLMKPKPFPKPLSPKTLERHRRNLAARTIQRAFRSKR